MEIQRMNDKIFNVIKQVNVFCFKIRGLGDKECHQSNKNASDQIEYQNSFQN